MKRETQANAPTLYVGLDVHKDSVDVATAEPGADGEVRHVGSTKGDVASVLKPIRRLISAGHRPLVVYEAGSCGFVLYRALTAAGIACEVIAPSSIARAPGERIKTDRLDAMMLARKRRSGEVRAVRVPDEGDEAIRDLTRAREDAVREQRNARHRLKALLLRNGIGYEGKSSWTAAHLRWLASLKLPLPAQQIAFQEYLHAITESGARIVRLEAALVDALGTWALAPIVAALQTLRGVQLIAAITLVAEIQDFQRFAHPRQLMSYLGLVPSEHSSGTRRRQGAITKAGNRAARRILVEIAHHYQHPARLTPIIARRQAGQDKAITDIAWNAQARLCARYRRLCARQLTRTKVIVAIARELVGFIWDIARRVPIKPAA